MMLRSPLLSLLTLLLSLTTAACRQQTAEEVESESPVPVKTAEVTTGPMRGVVHATGTVTPAPGAELVVIAPEAARIVEIPKAEGDRVMRGDLLVRFEIPTLAAEVPKQAAEVQRAQAQLANARASQTRSHELFDRGVAARKETEDADRAVAEAEAAVAQANASRNAAVTSASRQEVRATFDGVIAKRFHNAGDLVEGAASDPVLRVIDPRRLEVVAAVPINDFPRVTIGAPARLSSVPAGRPDAALRVVSRPAQVETGTATIPVRLAFAVAGLFPAGTPVEVDIEAEQHKAALLIPAPALVREGEETAVFVVEGKKAKRRPVQIGLTDGEHIEVLSGVKAGEMVIVEGQAGLPDDATITVGTGEENEKGAAEPDDKKDDKDKKDDDK